jgi:hypothetical protein
MNGKGNRFFDIGGTWRFGQSYRAEQIVAREKKPFSGKVWAKEISITRVRYKL